MIITLPWPDAILFPNQSMREGARYLRRTEAASYREASFWTSNCQFVELASVGKIKSLAIDFYPPNSRRDLDGMLSAIKPGIDGIFDAIQQNDSQITEIMIVKHPADKLNPRVVISLIEKEN